MATTTETKPKPKHNFPPVGKKFSQIHCDGMLFDAGCGPDIVSCAVAAAEKAMNHYGTIGGEEGPTAQVLIRQEEGAAGYVYVDYRILGPFLMHVMRDALVEQVGVMSFNHRKVV